MTRLDRVNKRLADTETETTELEANPDHPRLVQAGIKKFFKSQNQMTYSMQKSGVIYN